MALIDNAQQKHLDALVRAGGGIYAGVGESMGQSPSLVYFHDPETHSTLSLPLAGVSSDQVRHRLAESRESFASARIHREAVHGEGDRNAHGKN